MKVIVFLTASQSAAGTSTGVWIIMLAQLLPLALLGIFALVCIFLCRAIARRKGLSESYMWLGLAGIIGLIIVAVIPGKSKAEILMEQKQLLDLGLITAEEFEEQKKQILTQQGEKR